MKRQLINSFILATLLFAGCKKDDGRYPTEIALQRVPYVNVKIDASGSQAIDLLNLTSFQGKYTITLLYPDDIKPAKVDVVVIKNGNKNVVKVIQAGVTTFPGSYTITAAQLAAAFGAPIALGDNYDIGADIYTSDAVKYEAFPAATGATSYGGTGQANQPNFTPTARFSALCAYDPNIYQGNFLVVTDKWNDTSPGDVIVLTKIDATHFSFNYNPTNHVGTLVGSKPIIVTVDPATNTPSIAKQTVGTAWTYDPPNAAAPTARTQAGAANSVTPCAGAVSLNMVWGEEGVEYGPYLLTLKKQ